MTDVAGNGQRPVWLLSDFAGVLGRHQSQRDQQQMAAVAKADFDAFWEAYWAERQAYDAGETSGVEYWQRVVASTDATYAPSLVTTLDRLDVESWLRPDEETLRVTEELMKAGTRLAVLSNAPLSLAAALHALPWLGAFEQVICSSEIRAAKPDPDCYLKAVDLLETTVDEVTFIDDREVNVVGAQALGIRSVLFFDAAQLRRDLLS
ncbi:HAD-IA family hydrolase [Streptomyces sp. MBT62]|uniref:HAD-IA family hydrolase n=1 Tax=Streptomyces sp. MBT62 TaxID=2800410 RepID=UPI001909D303|nr:HAD-IA family hydrolase [Streptomyces sp. MBT62]MBK3571426.1 HAD-IA family hydrolase [Streptomyces sp. MBT62]